MVEVAGTSMDERRELTDEPRIGGLSRWVKNCLRRDDPPPPPPPLPSPMLLLTPPPYALLPAKSSV